MDFLFDPPWYCPKCSQHSDFNIYHPQSITISHDIKLNYKQAVSYMKK